MLPKGEGSVYFEAGKEIGYALDATATYSTDGEFDQIRKRLLPAEAPYMLTAPYGEIALQAMRKLAAEPNHPELTEILEKFEAVTENLDV